MIKGLFKTSNSTIVPNLAARVLSPAFRRQIARGARRHISQIPLNVFEVLKNIHLTIFPFLLLGFIVTTHAQEPTPKAEGEVPFVKTPKTDGKVPPYKNDVKIQDKSAKVPVKVVETKFGFETKVVKDAPYSATVEVKTVQSLADGNTIEDKSTSNVYRNSEGQTRREREIKTKGPVPVKEVMISDPLRGVSYSLDENRKVAVRFQVDLEKFKLQEKPVKTVNAAGPDDNVKPLPYKEKASPEALQAMKAASPERKDKSADGFVKTPPKDADPAVKWEKPAAKAPAITEPLGKKVIEGLECEGKRTTLTIPAGEVGNTLPINITSEQWYSPDLQVLVLTRHNDPRSGETTYRLTDIKRVESPKSLFEVPADYTVLDKSETMKKTPVKNED